MVFGLARHRSSFPSRWRGVRSAFSETAREGTGRRRLTARSPYAMPHPTTTTKAIFKYRDCWRCATPKFLTIHVMVHTLWHTCHDANAAAQHSTAQRNARIAFCFMPHTHISHFARANEQSSNGARLRKSSERNEVQIRFSVDEMKYTPKTENHPETTLPPPFRYLFLLPFAAAPQNSQSSSSSSSSIALCVEQTLQYPQYRKEKENTHQAVLLIHFRVGCN